MRPKPQENNVWFRNDGSDTVIIFVHGIFSDSASCWQAAGTGTTPGAYWPELVTTDPRLGTPDIFLAGFFTKINAGPSAIRNCADEVYQGLTIPDSTFNDAPINRKRLIFVCHSAGGIVTRQMLVFHHADFQDREVGLLLLASPSAGSIWATRFGALARLYDYRLARELAWNSWSLVNLDDGFKNMIEQRQIPNLRGKEAYENRFIVSSKWLPNFSYVVEPESAGRYFGPAQLLPDTNHSTAVKPPDLGHPAHKLLVQFMLQLEKDFKKSAETAAVPVAAAVPAVSVPAPQTTAPTNPFDDYMESAMAEGAFFVEDPWTLGSPAVVAFKKKLRDAAQHTAELHNEEQWEQLIKLWEPLVNDPLFDVLHEEWEQRPFFTRLILDGKCALFVAHAQLLNSSTGDDILDHCKLAYALLKQVIAARPYDMQGPKATRLQIDEARVANENFAVTLRFALEWLKGWGYTAARMGDPPADPETAERMKAEIKGSAQQKLGQVEWILNRHPE